VKDYVRNRGVTLAETMVSMFILSLITVFLAQFYLLMGQTYQEIAVHSDIQRTMRKISSWMFREVKESAPSTESHLPILEPSSSQVTSTSLRFTRPVSLEDPRNPEFQTVKYYYDSDKQELIREIEGEPDSDRRIAKGITSLTFTWINDYKVRIDFTITRNIGGRSISAAGVVYLATRYRP